MENKNYMFYIIISVFFYLFNYNYILCENNYTSNLYDDLINKKYLIAKEKLLKIHKNDLSESNLEEYLIQIIFIDYKLNNLNEANNNLDKFIKIFSNSKHIDYIFYMKGLTNLKLDKYIDKKTFSYNYYKKDHSYINESSLYFNKIIDKYKNSKYYDKSMYNLLYIKRRIFIYNIFIIDHYFKRNLHISVINRLIDLLNSHFEEPYIYFIIKYMKKSSRILHLDEIENTIDLIIKENECNFKKLNININ